MKQKTYISELKMPERMHVCQLHHIPVIKMATTHIESNSPYDQSAHYHIPFLRWFPLSYSFVEINQRLV